MRLRKKWLLFPGIILVLLIAGLYIFIPGELTISGARVTTCNASAAFRSIGDEASWKGWWPGEGINGYSCRLSGKVYPQVGVSLQRGDHGVPGVISVLAAGLSDSIELLWKCRIATSLNPVTRFLQYREALGIRQTISAGLSFLCPFLEKTENVYGMDIRNGMSKDSTLVVTQQVTAVYPSTAEIYRSVHAIRSYITRQGAKETDYPMLHIGRRKDGSYERIVGIPVDRELKGTKELTPARFVPWKILTGEVHGGPFTAERAMDQLQLYVVDHQKTAMALPFQSLVTERDREPDTARWITRVVQCVP